MAKLIPDTGMLFYAEPTWHLNEVTIQDGVMVSVNTKSKDRSYSEKVMRCLAADNRAVVAEVAWGRNFGTRQHMLKVAEYEFHPVGPEVVAALGLVTATEQPNTTAEQPARAQEQR